jgi:hypothetical protein
VASNSGGNCAIPQFDGGGNIDFPDSPCPGSNGNPQLGPLADNGGPTQTHALGPGSAARDAIPANGANCAADDQRGLTRPAGAACDVGAYEAAAAGASVGAAGQVGPSRATLHGEVTPNLRETSYHFEYGVTTEYGSQTAERPAGSGAGAAPVTADVDGLVPNTLYHFRLVATSPDGTTASADGTFTTVAADPAPPVDPVAGLRPDSLTLTRSRVIALRVSCTGAEPCVGTARIRSMGRGARLLGSKAYSVAAGASRKVRVRLNRRRARFVRRNRVRRVRVTLAPGNATTLPLKIARRR